MADAVNSHPTAGRRRRDKGPPSMVPLAPGALPRLERVNDTESERSDGTTGEKDAKRQRSEPTTPVSTSSRMPYEYDALMGITRVGTKEAEWFEEDLDTPEYHDATEEPVKREETDDTQPELRSTGFQGGYGSSSLKECIDLLNAKNAKPRNTPAPLDSGVDQDSVSPPQVMSPSMEGPLTKAEPLPSSGSISQEVSQETQPANGSISQCAPQMKDEPQSQDSCDPTTETKPESSSSTREVKAEQEESKGKEDNLAPVKQEEHSPDLDSEDSFTPEGVVAAVQRLLATRAPEASANAQPDEGRETALSPAASRERTSALVATGEQGYGPYASQGARHARGRNRTPDPFLFSTTIFLEHEAAPNEAQDDPMGHLRSRLRCVEHNVETLRTRLTQVADLRDAQGIRRDHRTIVARLDEVEEYASANTFREFMVKIQRLESMLVTDGGGSIGEAIRVCTRRIEQQQASLDDVRSRLRTQDGQGEWSEDNSENISGRDNRPPG